MVNSDLFFIFCSEHKDYAGYSGTLCFPSTDTRNANACMQSRDREWNNIDSFPGWENVRRGEENWDWVVVSNSWLGKNLLPWHRLENSGGDRTLNVFSSSLPLFIVRSTVISSSHLWNTGHLIFTILIGTRGLHSRYTARGTKNTHTQNSIIIAFPLPNKSFERGSWG